MHGYITGCLDEHSKRRLATAVHFGDVPREELSGYGSGY